MIHNRMKQHATTYTKKKDKTNMQVKHTKQDKTKRQSRTPNHRESTTTAKKPATQIQQHHMSTNTTTTTATTTLNPHQPHRPK